MITSFLFFAPKKCTLLQKCETIGVIEKLFFVDKEVHRDVSDLTRIYRKNTDHHTSWEKVCTISEGVGSRHFAPTYAAMKIMF
jgi:hypothetical protein